jgi:hypothetical protein
LALAEDPARPSYRSLAFHVAVFAVPPDAIMATVEV